MSTVSIDEILTATGFPNSPQVQGRSSVADLFRRRRCGIYVLHFSNGDYYVGQTVNVVRRFAQHRHNHDDIQKISFKQVHKKQLDDEERSTVYVLENGGFRLRNIQIVSFSYGETDFDLIMSGDEQDKWLNDLDYQDLAGDRVVDDVLRSNYTRRFKQFCQLPFSDEITHVLREYVRNSVPAVRRGEVAFWAISCLPPSPSNALYARVNVGWQTAFDAYVVDGKPTFYWYLTRSLAEKVLGVSLNDLEDDFVYPFTLFEPYADMEVFLTNSPLVKGGEDQVWVIVEGSTNVLRLMRDDYLLAAVRLFNFGLVQKGPCPWGKNHCLDLADKLVE